MVDWVIRKVFRMGVLELGKDFFRHYNHTSSTEVKISEAQFEKWKEFLEKWSRKCHTR